MGKVVKPSPPVAYQPPLYKLPAPGGFLHSSGISPAEETLPAHHDADSTADTPAQELISSASAYMHIIDREKTLFERICV